MSLNIIIADDAAFIREALIQICKNAGHLVIAEAKNGEEAVKLSLELKPDLIIMDMVMPIKNGVQAIREIREFGLDVQIIGCTSVDQDFLIAQAHEAGANSILLKPFKKNEVIAILNSIQSESMAKGGSWKS
jgi:two-component system chemotaxis response regulator CheY